MKAIGMVVIVLAGIPFVTIAILGLLRIVDDARMNRIWSSLHVSGDSEKVFAPEMVGPPDVAQRYLLHAIKPGTPLARRVELQMSGMIKPKEAGPCMPLQVTQILTAGHGFVWKAKAKAAGPIL